MDKMEIEEEFHQLFENVLVQAAVIDQRWKEMKRKTHKIKERRQGTGKELDKKG